MRTHLNTTRRTLSLFWRAVGLVSCLVFLVLSGVSAQATEEEAHSQAKATGNAYTGSWAQVKDILWRIRPPRFPPRDCDIGHYGAVPDVSNDGHDSRPAIQAAIAACSAAGGGRVVIPAGIYLVDGPIHLQSNIDLHLETGAKLVFGVTFANYLPVVLTRWEGTLLYNYSPLIYAYRTKNIAITGHGELDGQLTPAWNFMNEQQANDQQLSRSMNNSGQPLEERIFGEGHYLRPSFIEFFESENILIDGLVITDCPFRCVHPVFSRNITIRQVTIDSQNPNNIGIVPDSSEDILIDQVALNTADDNMDIKSGRDREGRQLNRPSRNIVVQNCRLQGVSGLSIGSEMSGGVENIFIEACQSPVSSWRGLYLKANQDRGGFIRHIRARRLTFNEVSSLVEMDANRGTTTGGYPPAFSDVRVEDVTAATTGATALDLVGGLDLAGVPTLPITDVVLRNLTVDQTLQATRLKQVDNLFLQNVWINGQLVLPDATNLPPDVYAGADRQTTLNRPIILLGQARDDLTPLDALSFQWTVESGDPAAVDLFNPAKWVTLARFSAPGEYVLRLTVNDGEQLGVHRVRIRVAP